MALTLDNSRDFRALLSHLPEDYADLAVEHRQLQLQYGNAKIRTADDLLRTFFVHVGGDLSVRQTSAVLRVTSGLEISPMRIHKKMLRAPPYLHALVERMAPREGNLSAERWLGYAMVSADATTVVGPGADCADARIHTAMRLSDLALVEAKVTGVDVGETLKNFACSPGQLWIGDRGYCNANGIEHARDRGAAVLLRLNIHAMPVMRDAEGSPFHAAELLAWMGAFPGHAVHERRVAFETRSGSTIEARIVARRLRDAEAVKAREWMRREHKAHEISAQMDQLAGYMVLITTSRLSAAQAIEAYRLRWQIELQFKRWKSLCGFDRMPNFLDDTIVAWIYVKVLLGLLLERLASASAEVFPPERNEERRHRSETVTVADLAAAVARHQAALDGHRPMPDSVAAG